LCGTTAGTADQEYLDAVASKMTTLNQITATAKVQWKPTSADPGALFEISAELDAGKF
jgi:hypothetical protein